MISSALLKASGERMDEDNWEMLSNFSFFPGEFPQIWIYIEIAEEASQLSDF